MNRLAGKIGKERKADSPKNPIYSRPVIFSNSGFLFTSFLFLHSYFFANPNKKQKWYNYANALLSRFDLESEDKEIGEKLRGKLHHSSSRQHDSDLWVDHSSHFQNLFYLIEYVINSIDKVINDT